MSKTNPENLFIMKHKIYFFSLLLFFSGFSLQVSSQNFIKKVKKKAEDAAVEKVFEKIDGSEDESGRQSSSSENTGTNNTRGDGLSSSAPDVKQNIDDARLAYGNKEYSDARYSIRQAILGVELEIGKNILDDLPESIGELSKVPSEDNVTSSGIGFVGLIIQRVYRGDDQEFTVTIGNDAGLLSITNMYLSAGNYATTSEDQNYKQTRFKDYKAIIEYDEDTGYKLSVPFGQSSVLVTEGVNYNTEEEFMDASQNIDIETVKQQLGEQ